MAQGFNFQAIGVNFAMHHCGFAGGFAAHHLARFLILARSFIHMGLAGRAFLRLQIRFIDHHLHALARFLVRVIRPHRRVSIRRVVTKAVLVAQLPRDAQGRYLNAAGGQALAHRRKNQLALFYRRNRIMLLRQTR